MLGKARVRGLTRPGRSGLVAEEPSQKADVQNWVGWGSLCRGVPRCPEAGAPLATCVSLPMCH